MPAYYNEFDKRKAAWLRELIRRDVIAQGDVDERSIADVRSDDLAGYSQCHFFAGIGVWSWALRAAGWPDDRPVWTGSCPCQPFSQAGKGEALEDERHLFPAWFGLIEARRPVVVFGEQVADGDGLTWLDVVRASMDAAGYTLGVVDSCAAGFGAPQRSQRLYFVAEAEQWPAERHGQQLGVASSSVQREAREQRVWLDARDGGISRDVGTPNEAGLQGREFGWDGGRECAVGAASVARGPVNGFWRDAEWVYCRDQKYRPVKPGTFPLAHGAPARVLRIRGYGDAIVGPQAVEFIKAYMELRGERGEVA